MDRLTTTRIWVMACVALLTLLALLWFNREPPSEIPKVSVAPADLQPIDGVQPQMPVDSAQQRIAPAPKEPDASVKHLIEFEGYPSVEITIHDRNDEAIPPTTDNFGAVYADWIALAEQGDALYAYAADQSLRQCKRSHTTAEALEEAVALLHNKLIYRDGSGDPDSTIVDSDLTDVEESMRAVFEYCRGLPHDEVRKYQGEWLKQAADKDYYPAVLGLGQALLDEGKKVEALKYFEQAWQSGSRVSLGQLSYLHGADGAEGNIDPIVSAAYLHLNREVFNVLYRQEERGPIATRFYASMEQRLDYALRSLRPHQQDEVMQLARQMLVRNVRCCKSF